MKIEIITMWYNEQFLAPFFLNHYSWADKIHIIIDADTNDQTRDIAKQYPNVHLEEFAFPDMMDDLLKVKKINEKYKSLKSADYVIVVDSDEFIFCNNPEDPVRDHIMATSKDVYFVNLWQIYKNKYDLPLNSELAVYQQRRHGDPRILDSFNILYVKPIIVKGGKEINWMPGNHQLICNNKVLCWKDRDFPLFTSLNVTTKRDEMLQGAHWRLVDLEQTIIRRINNRKERQSQSNLRTGLTYHYHKITEAEIIQEYESHMSDPEIIKDDGIPNWVLLDRIPLFSCHNPANHLNTTANRNGLSQLSSIKPLGLRHRAK
jgi:hypothetical protein